MKCEDQIHAVLHSNRRENWAIEGEFQVAVSLAGIRNMDVYIYGAGQDIWSAVGFFKNRLKAGQLKGIIDINEKKDGTLINGVPVYSCSHFQQIQIDADNSFVFIWTYCINFRELSIVNFLHDVGINSFYIIKPSERFYLTGFQHELAWNDSERPQYYLNHEMDLCILAESLEDQTSVDTLLEYLKTYMESGFYRGNNIATKFKYFLDEGG